MKGITQEKIFTAHKGLVAWVGEMEKLCRPERVYWCDGSEEEKERLQREAVSSGELIELNSEKLPGCFLHRSAENDVARVEHLTYICTRSKDDAGPNNNWMNPEEGYRKASAIFQGSMKGRTMYVIPFSMGPISSPFSKIGIELTDSIYVVLNMRIMTRVGKAVLDSLGSDGEFTKGLHSKADLKMERRLILHFPEDNTIWSVGSGYGGNVLLGKKCLALRIASWLGRKEGWLAEHMLILGIEKDGVTRFVAAAFPSACGKTNLAMLVPPEGLKHKGYRIWTVGDDIAWLRIGTDGRLYAINPENGFFGVLPGTNSKTNRIAIETIQRNTIYTNVVLCPDGTVWWEGSDGEPPKTGGIDWRGNSWKPGMKDDDGKPVFGAHPNSRFTAPVTQCPTYTSKADEPQGVPISAIIFGGRRARVAPLVSESFNWQHGVYVGAQMASERTAAQVGKLGEVRRDPMAMFPFCGYNMADYWTHWLAMGKKMPAAPNIFHVNWFRQDQKGRFLWPGFGENLRVIEWILNRVEGKVEARKTPIGYVPQPGDIDLTGLSIDSKAMEELFAVDSREWIQDLKSQEEFFSQFAGRLPKEIREEFQALRTRLRA